MRVRGAAVSLLELVSIMAVIGILSAVAVPNIQRYIVRGKIASVLPVIDVYKIDIMRARTYGVVFGNTSEDLIAENAGNKPKYLSRLTRAAYGCLEAVFDLEQLSVGHNDGQEIVLLLCPIATNSSADNWQCGYSADTTQDYVEFLPVECQEESTPNTEF